MNKGRKIYEHFKDLVCSIEDGVLFRYDAEKKSEIYSEQKYIESPLQKEQGNFLPIK